jgi:Mn-dependent DtxR family transcriptional regulator
MRGMSAEEEKAGEKGKYLETGPDRLLELVQKKKKITTGEAAAVLRINRNLIEEWAKILSEHGLIEIDYGIMKTTLREKR